MTYFYGTWEHDFPDDPVWMAYEVTSDGAVVRRIESFPSGRTEYETAADEGVVSLIDTTFDLTTFDLSDPTMSLVEITAQVFEELWAVR